MRGELDRIFERFFGDYEPYRAWTPTTVRAYPPINLWQDDEHLYLEAELPGLPPEAVNITATRDELDLSGVRPELDAEPVLTVHRRERPSGPFERNVRLPLPVDPDATQAVFDQGILTITLTKDASVRPHRIEVRSARSPEALGEGA
jgi:HSP20 family protein